jgi:hypothetical protein
MTMKFFIGFDMRMPTAYGVAVSSLKATTKNTQVTVTPLLLPDLEAKGLYTRPTFKTDSGLHDVISNAPMSTQFALTRFLIPYLCDYKGWAFFCDSDFLFLDDVSKIQPMLDDTKAVMVVKHKYAPLTGIKMDGQAQSAYPRKNWSSFIAFNCGHPANRYLTPEAVNKDKGLFLHGFSWIHDSEIGELPEAFNWLEGHSSPDIQAVCVHHTRGTPDMVGYENIAYAEEWREYARRLVVCRLAS